MALDLRPSMAPSLEAFGVAITVTRPSPSTGSVATTGIWISPLVEVRPFGTELQRRDPRQVLAVLRTAALPELPRGTTILAPDQAGAAVRTWRVDGYDRVEVDELRVILVPVVA